MRPAAAFADRFLLGDHHADAGAVDVRHGREIDQDLVAPLVEQVVNLLPQGQIAVVDEHLAGEDQQRHVADAALHDLQLRDGRFVVSEKVVRHERLESSNLGAGSK